MPDDTFHWKRCSWKTWKLFKGYAAGSFLYHGLFLKSSLRYEIKWKKTKRNFNGGKEKNWTKPNEIINKQKLSLALISEEKLAAESK